MCYKDIPHLICTVRFVERNYTPFLVNFVKAQQPDQQASVDAHQSFLQVECGPCRDGRRPRSRVDRRRRNWPLDGTVDF